MFDLPIMILVAVCALIAWRRDRRKNAVVFDKRKAFTVQLDEEQRTPREQIRNILQREWGGME